MGWADRHTLHCRRAKHENNPCGACTPARAALLCDACQCRDIWWEPRLQLMIVMLYGVCMRICECVDGAAD